MIHKEKILKLKKDFIQLHAEYKSHCADQDNPALVPQHEADQSKNCRQKLSAIVDRMLEIMLQIIDLSTEYEKGQENDPPTPIQSTTPEVKRGRGRPKKTVPPWIRNEDQAENEDVTNDQLVPFATSLGHCLVSVDTINDLSLPPWSRPGPKSKTRTTTSSNTLSTLLSPEVRLDSLPLLESTVKEEPLSDAEENNHSFPSDSSSSSSDSDDSDSESSLSCPDSNKSETQPAKPRKQPADGRKRCKRKGRKKLFTKPKKPNKESRESSNQKWAEQCVKFQELTEPWMYLNRPAPPAGYPEVKLISRNLTADQQRDIYEFHKQYKDHFHSRLIWDRLIEKYYLTSVKTARSCVNKGRDGQEFGFKKKQKYTQRPECKDAIQEMIAYCKANPMTFNCCQLSKKYGWHRFTVSQILKEHGIRVFTPDEKRAMRLSMEGKQYVPFFRTKEEAQYHRMRQSERKQRRKTGDMSDGRSARYKDPNWRNLRQEIGVPEGVKLYAKEERREKAAKKAVLSRLPPEERKLIASTLYMGSAIHLNNKKVPKSIAPVRTKPPRKRSTEPDHDGNQGDQSTLTESESNCSTQPSIAEPSHQTTGGQHHQPSTSSGWSLQFDPHSGSLFHQSTRSSTAAAAAAALQQQYLTNHYTGNDQPQQQQSFTDYSQYYQQNSFRSIQ